MSLLYHVNMYLEFLILACTIYILASTCGNYPKKHRPPILDFPMLEKPTLDYPTLEKPTLENPTQLNKDINN